MAYVLAAQLGLSLAERQRVRLREEVAHELVVVGHDLALEVHALLALDGADEVARNHAPLVDELVERVLPVGARLAEVHLAALVRKRPKSAGVGRVSSSSGV